MAGHISTDLRQRVIERAGERCEYCLLHQSDAALFGHEVDHIIPQKHQGQTVEDNLALACFECNRYKGSDVTSIDPLTDEVIPLFNPRRQNWAEHFSLKGRMIVPLTAAGRVTVNLLRLNAEQRLRRREELVTLGSYRSST